MVDFDRLRAAFPPDRISWRIGSTTQDKARGMALAYLDSRDVQDRLDDVCGPWGWQCTYPHATVKTVCAIGIKNGDEWIWKSDGAGDTDVEAEKGALSDAFKRAGVKWGIGRYLYDVPATWVELEAAGRSYKIKESEYPKLQRVLASMVIGGPSAAETAAINAINECKSRGDLIALLNRDAETLKALPNGGADRVRARADERLKTDFPKPAMKDAAYGLAQ